MSQITLDKESFASLIRNLTLMKDICNDVDIRNGIIRQRSNDKLSCFEIDLNPIIGDMNLPLSSFKNKLDLFKIFQNQEHIVIESNDNDYSFSDSYTKIVFEKPHLEWLDNQFMTEADRDSIFIRDEGNIIMTTDISESMSARIQTITGAFQVTVIQIAFANDKAMIAAQTQGKDQYANIISNIVCERELTAESYMPHTPFVIDHDGDIEFKMYLSSEEKMECTNVFKTTVSDVDVSVYCRSAIITDLED